VGKWFYYHIDEDRYPYNISEKQWNRFLDVIGNVGNIYRREAKMEMIAHSMEKCIQNQELPANGQQGLLDAILRVKPWVQSFISPHPPFITKLIYGNMSQNLFAALYACSPQGRIGGIMSLKYKHASKLLTDGYILATEFKTAKSHITQPVILQGEAILFFRVYVDIFRPISAAAYAEQNHRPMNHPEDPLFLTFDGEEETRAGRYTKQFFMKHCELTTTTNKARGLIETIADDLGKNGSISEITRDGISNISGHSSQIFKAHYHKRSRERDVEGARELMDVIRGHNTEDYNTTEQHPTHKYQHFDLSDASRPVIEPECEQVVGHNGALYTSRNEQALNFSEQYSQTSVQPLVPQQRHHRFPAAPPPMPRVWGRLHPEFNKPIGPNSRFVWSVAELKYVREYVESHGGPDSPGVCARMLKHIKGVGFNEAQHIFHAKHVLTTGRLHHGIRRVFSDRCSKIDENEEETLEDIV